MSLLRVRVQALSRASRLCYAARRSYSDMDHDSAGSIRSAGGAFGKKEKAIEDQYFQQLDTISGFKKIIDGELDDLPEVAFYMVGPIEEVVANAKRLAEQQQQQ